MTFDFFSFIYFITAHQHAICKCIVKQNKVYNIFEEKKGEKRWWSIKTQVCFLHVIVVLITSKCMENRGFNTLSLTYNHLIITFFATNKTYLDTIRTMHPINERGEEYIYQKRTNRRRMLNLYFQSSAISEVSHKLQHNSLKVFSLKNGLSKCNWKATTTKKKVKSFVNSIHQKACWLCT